MKDSPWAYDAQGFLFPDIVIIERGGRSVRQITGNKLLVRALKEEGVDTVFGYPGAYDRYQR